MVEQYLERLFTWESLVNTERGVEFELKNRLMESELTGVGEARLDGERVPAEDVTLHLEDGTVLSPDDVSEETPLAFDLADTVQVVVDRERLTRGTHEVGLALAIDGFGSHSFTVEDQVTDEDLLDVDPADYTVAELRELVADVASPLTLDRLHDRERDGKDRKTAIEAIEARQAEVDDVEEPATDDADEPGQSELSARMEELLSLVVETPQQVQVYTAGWVGGGGTVAEIADRTLFSEERVQTLLGELEAQDLVVREDGHYEMVHPITAMRKQPRNLWNLLGP
ncbi:MarR family transcriptional regulator [Halorarius halobius]|uniref:MarR family transcriptional regulator n=1 Tax=Halorarius halobius TaxID=2962671 RepID=UPI0020CE9055|nr:helix-turn-helix domain-containing protein [Halorarius halobius]